MSRSGYSDDCEHLELYRANVRRSIEGKKGQAFLRELAAEMDAMPEKILIGGYLVDADGQCCTIGVVCKARGIDTLKIDHEDPHSVGDAVGISRVMAAEIAYENDDDFAWRNEETPEHRWQRMRKWVQANIKAREGEGE